MYEEIRPFNDAEASEALRRVSTNPNIKKISKYLFPDQDADTIVKLLSNVKTVDQFQNDVMSVVIKAVILKSTDGLTYDGLDYFNKDSKGRVPKYLLLSNHRDIVLDAGFTQIIFFDNHLPLTEIAVGDNLVKDSFFEDIIRSNRMIKVTRSLNPREVYSTSKVLSEYIRMRITENANSIWLAQRQGRTKDGNDFTEQGLLKMLAMSGTGDFVKDFMDVRILPVSFSYEFESCDILKAIELVKKAHSDKPYVKAPDEDYNSMLTGIRQPKGRIHVSFCEPITYEELSTCSTLDHNMRFQCLGAIIDDKIHRNYKLYPNNFIALDLLRGNNEHCNKYYPSEKDKFVHYMNTQLKKVPEGIDLDEVEKIFLEIYANPIINR
ncbi:MAG: acyltransferase [Bacteroidales bacterium]|jgi:hypothetical protein|nr:acyltransferase [Bacteroidales bacterium]MCI2122056.1 acyltransferase [Bacteroidales bacterium]MCI2144824.1 acyltransferase [Bacteroidales bacterium]